MDHAALLEIDQVLDGKYRIEGLIGHGGMGTVYRARHLALDASRAIKVVKTEMAEELKLVERLREEALLAESLRHPHLVSLYDFSSLPDGTPYIVWELVEGETVAERLARGERFSTADVVRLVAQIADGLDAAHRRGILHRDISPDNIMVSERDGELMAKVLDFGIAKGVQRPVPMATGPSLFLGKIGYASPEQMGFVGDRADLDARTDVFSLAVVCYYMLTGRHPFRASSARAYLHDVVISDEREAQGRFLHDVDDAWAGVFRHALSRTRNERTPSMGAFKAALEAVWRDHPIEIDDGGRTRALHSSPSRHSKFALAASMLALVLAAPLMFWRVNSPEAPPGPSSSTTTVRPQPTTTTAPAGPQPATSSSTSSVPATTSVLAPAEPEFGRLVLTATPNATVTVDGRLMGITPTNLQLRPGRHEISLTASEGFRWRGIVGVDPGGVTTLHRRLDLFGSITVTADVWAAVSLDGGDPEQTPIAFSRVSVGLHEIRLFRDGFVEQVHEIVVEEGENRSVNVTMERRP